ncbi:thymidine kinase [Bacillus subtilis]|uniref:thymidine kinase n=1 Tax=Bacillus subtilis TaxID=1423 RepID=UPI0021D7E3F6|nr:thymidine kinase [Bacillus subtilis]
MAKLVFYYGSMNSSKTAQLIMTAYNFNQQGKKFEIVKSAEDTRDTKVKSRALNIEMGCAPINNPDDLYKVATTKAPDWLFVDEVQFMNTEMIDTLSKIVDELGVNVIAYGLMTDFRGQLFEGSKRLVESADSIREIKNQCIYCQNKAIRNMRLLNDMPVFEGEIIQPGGNEAYVSVCRSCYNKCKKDTEIRKRE